MLGDGVGTFPLPLGLAAVLVFIYGGSCPPSIPGIPGNSKIYIYIFGAFCFAGILMRCL